MTTRTAQSSIQHLTRDELTLAQGNVEALKTALSDYAAQLEKASTELRHYLADPDTAGLTAVLCAESAVHSGRHKWPHLISAQIRDLATEAQRVRELEKRRSANVS